MGPPSDSMEVHRVETRGRVSASGDLHHGYRPSPAAPSVRFDVGPPCRIDEPDTMRRLAAGRTITLSVHLAALPGPRESCLATTTWMPLDGDIVEPKECFV